MTIQLRMGQPGFFEGREYFKRGILAGGHFAGGNNALVMKPVNCDAEFCAQATEADIAVTFIHFVFVIKTDRLYL